MWNSLIVLLDTVYLYLIIGGSALAVIIAVLLIFFLVRNKKPKKDDFVVNANEWEEALGGKDNVVDAYAAGSRLNVQLKDAKLVNEERIKELGVSSIIKMSGKIVLVVEDKAEYILSKIKENSGK